MDIRSINKGKMVLWIGDRVSRESPSNIPDRQDLFRYIIEESCGKQVLANLYAWAEHYNKTLCKVYKPLGILIQPELMMEELSRIHGINLTCGIGTFVEAEYNKNHYYIAQLLEAGIDIVTTNYDLCIEKAYEAFMNKEDSMKPVQMDNGVWIYECRSKKHGRVYHIHGSAEEPGGIGRTGTQGKEYFSQEFRDKVDKWVTDGYKIFFLGYNCCDIADVNLYLYQRISALTNRVRWKACYVNEGKKEDIPITVKKVFRFFQKGEVIEEDTAYYIEQLSQLMLGDKWKKYKKDTVKTPPKWKEGLKPELKKAGERKDLLLFSISHSLGIRMEELDEGIFERIENAPPSISRQMKTLMLCGSGKNISDTLYRNQIQDVPEGEEKLEKELFYFMQTEFDPDRRKIQVLETEVETIKREYLFNRRRGKEEDAIMIYAASLRREIDRILPKKEGNYPDSRGKYYAHLFRLRAALQAILSSGENEIPDCLNDILDAYTFIGQSVNICEIFNIMCYEEFCYRVFFYKYKKRKYYDKSQRIKAVRKKAFINWKSPF